MRPLQTNGPKLTDKENTMPSPRPITGIFAPLKKKIVNKNIKSSGGNVKVVSPMTAAERGNRNASESARVRNTAFGTKDIMAHAEKNVTKGSTVSIRSNSGITGAGAKNVARLYRGGGIGMFGLPKNK